MTQVLEYRALLLKEVVNYTLFMTKTAENFTLSTYISHIREYPQTPSLEQGTRGIFHHLTTNVYVSLAREIKDKLVLWPIMLVPSEEREGY